MPDTQARPEGARHDCRDAGGRATQEQLPRTPSLSDEPGMANHSALLSTGIFYEWVAEAEGRFSLVTFFLDKQKESNSLQRSEKTHFK